MASGGNVVAKAWVQIIPEMSGIQGEITKELAGIDTSAEKAGSDSGKSYTKSFSAAVSSGAKTVGKAMAGIVAGGAALSGIASATAPAVDSMARLETAFAATGGTAEQAGQVYENFMGLVGDSDRATEAAQDMANLAEAGGDIDAWYGIAAGTVARFGDALPLENLIESANETARTGTVVGGMADALNWAGASAEQWGAALSGNSAAQEAFNAAIAQGLPIEDAMNAALATTSDMTQRQAILQSALTAVYGETGQAYLQNNAALVQSRESQAQLNQALAQLGEVLAPIMANVTSLAATLLTALQPVIQSIVGTIMQMMPTIQSIAAFLADNSETVLAVATALGVLVGVIKTATTVATLFNAVLSANPIMLVITAVTALASAMVYFFTQTDTGREIWSNFTSWLSGVWTGLQDFFGGIWDTISGFFTSAGEAVSSAWETVTSFFGEIPGRIQGFFSGIGQFFSDTFGNAGDAVRNAWDNVVSFFQEIPSRIKNIFSGAGQWLVESGKALLQGFVDGVMGAVSWVGDKISGALSTIRSFFPFSPAKRGPFSGRGYTTYSGKALMEDWGKAMGDEASVAARYAGDAAAQVRSALETGFSPSISARGYIQTAGDTGGNTYNVYIDGSLVQTDARMAEALDGLLAGVRRTMRLGVA